MMFTKTRHFDPAFVNTIEKDLIYHGHWWLPENPNDRVSGVLYLNKTGGIKLHLIGMFESDSSQTLGHEFADHHIILGQLVPGNSPVTVVHCKERQRESPYLSNVTIGAVQRFKADYIVFSYHAGTADQLNFSGFEFSTTYLVDWADCKQLEIKFDGDRTVVSTFPKKELVAHGTGYKIVLTSWVSTSLGGAYNSSQHSSFSIELTHPVSFEIFKENFQKPLLDLVQFGSSLLNSLTFINATPTGSTESVKLIATSEFDRITRATEPVSHYALFLLSDFDAVWSDFVTRWLSLYQNTRHIFRLYFDSLHIGFQFPVTKFLNMIQALESYHAEKSKTDNINLRIRLEELLRESSTLFTPLISDSAKFISRIIDTRNYYTHYSAKKKEKAAEGLELHTLTHTLRLVFNFHLLMACGLEECLCSQLIERNHYFRSVGQLVKENDFWKV